MEQAVNIIIADNENKVLILKRSKNSKLSSNLWNLPGGKVEEGETLRESVIREAKEETNLDIIPASKHFYIYFYPKLAVYGFKAKTLEERKIILNKEHSEFKWVSKEEFKNFKFTPSAKETLEKYFTL
ncbi:MAG: NUDIX hydrolase [Candidatus Aenigmarchaeota archaeon]|nr:NUDIX hydrolase [Candidatus Aenigmarchaeota archaeon]